MNLIDILLISLAVQGLLLSVILLYHAKNFNSYKWIAGVIFIIAESTIAMELFASNLFWRFPMLGTCIPVLKMALGPMIYFYTRSLVQGNKKLTLKSTLHFLPVLLDCRPQFVFLLYETGILSIPRVTAFYADDRVQNFLFQHSVIFDLPVLISLLAYSIVSYTIVARASKNEGIDTFRRDDLKWLRTFLYLIFALIAILFISVSITALPAWNKPYLYLPAIVMVYYLGMRLLIRQKRMTNEDVIAYNRPQPKSHFAATDAGEYQRGLIALMESEKLYLNPALKVDLVAARLGISEKQLSNLLNQHIGKSFNDFINEYRIQEAMNKLGDHSLRQYTIAAIALDCGFNSIATFQRCFKQFTGITPSAYQNNRFNIATAEHNEVNHESF
ncbi:helix-turn-helix domain-containing protein [Mucilaginibacter sp. SMC90]|uniref:helix-turn-helix domain-containing protein n=1 Tax=Mucilaginibacter sp. SMC90 TaxID=2929803 RepID=UPI001FB42E4E|nr:helix-turn-helix domain-containing protein [Mucilaginibacter sp. SMC90]UOE47466.1 helix-turn-helix domain-containing protein [Mucilaginibacter sp. SMC90]